MTKRVLVIGGLAAGPSAASKAARTNPNVDVTLFEQGEDVSYGICEIPYAISGVFPEDHLVSYTPQRLKEEKRITVRTLSRVEEIDHRNRTIGVRDMHAGRVYREKFDRLIIAAGSRPKKLGVTGEDARNVFTVKSLVDERNIRKFIDDEKPRHAVIIGGGYIGMEMAEALHLRGLTVTVLHLHDLPMKGLEQDTRLRVREELGKNGVRFVGGVKVEGLVVGDARKATHVVTTSGPFEADIIIVAIGVEPNCEFARASGIRLGEYGGILTNAQQQTNLEGIYAAGDCCEVRNIISNRSVYLPLATIASKAGWVAGENAAGKRSVFAGAIRAIAVKVFGLEVAHVGLGMEEARAVGFDVVTESVTAWSRIAKMPGSKKVTIHVIADRRSGRMVGANVYGEEGAVLRANTLAVAIQQKVPIADMQQWDLAYSPPFAPLWDPVLVAANAVAKKLHRV